MRRFLKPAPVLAIGLLVVAFVVAAGCGSSNNSGGSTAPAASTPASTATSGGTKGGAATVTMKGFAFSPHILTIKAGTTVTWTNDDSVPHNVVSADGISLTAAATSMFNSGTMSPGATFSFTFSKAGTYYYVCTIHKTIAAMHAEVVVQ